MIEFIGFIALFFPLILGGYITFSLLRVPDLSIESAFLMGAIFGVFGMTLGLGLVVSTLLALIGGALVSTTTALFHIVGKFPVLLAAILTLGIYHGISLLFLNNALHAVSSVEHELPILLGVGGGIFLLALFFFRSELGISFAIYGANPMFFQRHKISSRFITGSAFLVSGSLSGLSGFFFALSNGFAEVHMGAGIVLMILSALMLGKIAIPARFPTPLVPLVGTGIYLIIQQALVQLGYDLKYYSLFQALFFAALLAVEKRGKSQYTIDHLGV